MKTILITGCNGMLGTVAMKYYSDKYKCYGIDKAGKKTKNVFIEDLLNFEETKKIFKKVKPNIVLHCAALIDVKYCEDDFYYTYRSNILITEVMKGLCEVHNSKLVYISTSMIFDGKKYKPYTENDKPNPLNNYSLTKLEGENILNTIDNKLIIRTNIFGWKGFAKWVYESIKYGNELKMYKDMYFNCLYVKDFVKYLEPLLETKTGIYNLTSSDNISKYKFSKIIQKECLFKTIIKPIKYNDSIPRPLRAVLDCRKYEKEFGKLPTIKESIERFIKDEVI